MATLATKNMVEISGELKDDIIRAATDQVMSEHTNEQGDQVYDIRYITNGEEVVLQTEQEMPSGYVSVLDLFSSVPDCPDYWNAVSDYFWDGDLHDAYRKISEYIRDDQGKERWPNFSDFLKDPMVDFDRNGAEDQIREGMWESVNYELENHWVGEISGDEDPELASLIEDIEVLDNSRKPLIVKGIWLNEHWIMNQVNNEPSWFTLTWMDELRVWPYSYDIESTREVAQLVIERIPDFTTTAEQMAKAREICTLVHGNYN